MAEPVTTTATGAGATVGIMALLIGWLGAVGADVMMVVLASFAGTMVALSSIKEASWKKSITMVTVGILVSLVSAWSIAGLAVSYAPSLAGPYLPGIIAMMIGYSTDRLPQLLGFAWAKIESKVGVNNERAN